MLLARAQILAPLVVIIFVYFNGFPHPGPD